MTETTPFDSNLRRLFILRNITILGEIMAVGSIHFLLDVQLPLIQLGLIFLSMSVINVLTWMHLRRGTQANQNELFSQLLLDVIAFTAVLYLTGGATNPFAWYYLMPLVISATLLSRQLTWGMAALTIIAYSMMMFYYIPLAGVEMNHSMHMGHNMGSNDGFLQHIIGMWFGFVLSACLVAYFVVDMATTLRERDQHLAAAREEALRNERLIALGTLAAGAAHELGTPLATISIVSEDLIDDYPETENPDLNQKLQLIQDQIGRCKEALSSISASAGELRADSGYSILPSAYVDEIIAEWSAQRPGSHLEVIRPEEDVAKHILADRTITQAFVNVLNNAADTSPDEIVLQASWAPNEIEISILDRGSGISDVDLEGLGQAPFPGDANGLGVGLFLSYSSIKRFGGTISHNPRVGGGTSVTITLPYL